MCVCVWFANTWICVQGTLSITTPHRAASKISSSGASHFVLAGLVARSWAWARSDIAPGGFGVVDDGGRVVVLYRWWGHVSRGSGFSVVSSQTGACFRHGKVGRCVGGCLRAVHWVGTQMWMFGVGCGNVRFGDVGSFEFYLYNACYAHDPAFVVFIHIVSYTPASTTIRLWCHPFAPQPDTRP